MARELGTIVTAHALHRARERAGLRERDIIGHVASAVEHGRKAVHQPAWAQRPEFGKRHRADRTKGPGAKRGELRWVWDEPETIAYLIRLYRDRILVITAVDRATDAEAA